jgi:uncharacterized protein (DUF362 family)
MQNTQTLVSIVKGKDIRHMTREAVSLLGGIEDVLKPGHQVLIKPNMGVDLPSSSGTTTNPFVVAALVEIVKEAGAKRIIVGESSVVGYKADKIFDALEVRDLFKSAGAEVISLDGDKSLKVKVSDGDVLDSIRIHRTAWESDFIISVPVLKTHFQTVVSLGMKNMKGTLPDSMKKIMHRIGVKELKYEFELEHAVVDLISVLSPNLTVIDGITAQEGYKPGSAGVSGSPLPFDTVIAGFDPVATDAIGAYLMGFDPMEIPLIRRAFERGLGEARMEKIQTIGTPVEQVRKKFQPASIDGMRLEFKNIRLCVDKGCSGCRETTILALAGMSEEEINRIGEAEVLIGIDAEQSLPECKKILIGNCTKVLPYEGLKIEGCPPPSFYIKKCLKGEEKEIDW